MYPFACIRQVFIYHQTHFCTPNFLYSTYDVSTQDEAKTKHTSNIKIGIVYIIVCNSLMLFLPYSHNRLLYGSRGLRTLQYNYSRHFSPLSLAASQHRRQLARAVVYMTQDYLCLLDSLYRSIAMQRYCFFCNRKTFQ